MATSGNVPVSFGDFPGLDIRSAPTQQSGAVDLLNVDFDREGRVRARGGFNDLFSDASSGTYNAGLWSFPAGPGGWRIFAQHASSVDAINQSGTVVASQSIMGVAQSMVSVGTPSTAYYFLSVAGATLYYFSDSSWTTGAASATVDGVGSRAMPKGIHLTVQSPDNRLVVAGTGDPSVIGSSASGPNGATSGSSHVWFSDAGNPLSWDTDNFVQLTPGDGEVITGACAWGGQVFVFKQSRMFIFYGNSTDSDGNPVFNYRIVDLPRLSGVSGFSFPSPSAEGVYFLARDGVYLTRGGDSAVCVSDPIAPLFRGYGGSSFYDSSDTAYTDTYGRTLGVSGPNVMKWINGRLFLEASSASVNRTLVYLTEQDKWTLWSIRMTGIGAVYDSTLDGEFIFVNANARLRTFTEAATTDDGTAIASHYRYGYDDLGSVAEKRPTRVSLWGTGTVDVKLTRDFEALTTAKTATMGTAPALDEARVNANVKPGRYLGWQVEASSGAWSLNDVALWMPPDKASRSKTP